MPRSTHLQSPLPPDGASPSTRSWRCRWTPKNARRSLPSATASSNPSATPTLKTSPLSTPETPPCTLCQQCGNVKVRGSAETWGAKLRSALPPSPLPSPPCPPQPSATPPLSWSSWMRCGSSSRATGTVRHTSPHFLWKRTSSSIPACTKRSSHPPPTIRRAPQPKRRPKQRGKRHSRTGR